MLKNYHYDKIKLLHQLSCITWFIEKHAKDNAVKAQDDELATLLEKIETDIEQYTHALYDQLCSQ